jgi:Plant mobile domain
MLNDAFFQFVWRPYDDEAVAALIPEYCLLNKNVWRASVPILCMHVVEWHHPDRVLRQFGMEQHIPTKAVNLDKLGFHGRDLRGQTDVDWLDRHGPLVEIWQHWPARVFSSDQPARQWVRLSQYSEWYRSITWRWLDPIGGSMMYAVRKSYSISRVHVFNIFVV